MEFIGERERERNEQFWELKKAWIKECVCVVVGGGRCCFIEKVHKSTLGILLWLFS